jgi:signal transduction histidine kinase/CheY-like chemotaxis protein
MRVQELCRATWEQDVSPFTFGAGDRDRRDGHRHAGSERLRAEQIRLLFHSGPIGTASALVAAFVLVFILLTIGAVSRLAVYIWLLVIVLDVILHLGLAWAYKRRRGAGGDTPENWRPWAHIFVAFCIFEGAIWAAGATYLLAPQAIVQQLLLGIVVCAICTGSLSAFGVYLPAFYGLFLTATIPYAILCVVRGGFIHQSLAVLVVVYIGGMLAVARMHNENIMEMLRLRFENADLAAELKVQKEAAEEASLAKTRFLAAASHDLRQPVHALSLFVGALRELKLAEEPGRLVDQIEDSVSAMDGLFSSLLDISRLDAGVIVPDWKIFGLQPLLDRLERDYANEAAAKGLRLTVRPCARATRSDPILLERILRNLVSNAVRYTDRGGVLMGVRHRGDKLRIEIWDTGRGIPQALAQRVFEEFYQLENPERDRAKGLGLGLAIVRRLADLLAHPVTLRSVPGRGSVFSVEVPRLAEMVAPEPVADTRAGPCGFILVVDDEVSIQEGMRSLLQGWGHRVLCGGSGREILERAAGVSLVPDLIICDYRLRGEENGAAVIQQLRATYGTRIPALLITGDTAPDRLEEASRSGLLLLHKPVSNSRLRAAVGNLLRNM